MNAMKKIQLILSLTLICTSKLFAQTGEAKSISNASSELAILDPSEAKKSNQTAIQKTSEIKNQDLSEPLPIIVETKRLPIKDMFIVEIPEHTSLIVVVNSDDQIVNEILCNEDDKKIPMDLSYLPKGKYTIKFESKSKTLKMTNFKKGRVRYQ